MKVKVTQEHIDNGEPGDCNLCPIALSVTAQTGAKTLVSPSICYVGGDSYKLPQIAKNFIKDFDKGCKVEPFEFVMRKQ